jgi:hypothetical protein
MLFSCWGNNAQEEVMLEMGRRAMEYNSCSPPITINYSSENL